MCKDLFSQQLLEFLTLTFATTLIRWIFYFCVFCDEVEEMIKQPKKIHGQSLMMIVLKTLFSTEFSIIFLFLSIKWFILRFKRKIYFDYCMGFYFSGIHIFE